MDRRLSRRTALLGPLGLLPAAYPSPADARGAQSSPASATVSTFRGNPARTGEHPGPGPRAPVNALWSTRLGTAVSSTPALVGGVLFVGSISEYASAGGALHAVDARTGEKLWRRQTAMGDALFASPAVVDGIVYAASYDGIVIAARADSGEELWRFQADAAIFSSPVVWNDTVALGDKSGRFYGLAASTGDERWRFGPDDPYRMSSNVAPAAADGTLFVVRTANYAGEQSILHALHAESGEERWRFVPQAGNQIGSATCVAGGRVHASTVEGSLHALSVDDGTEVWRYDGGGVVQTLPALAGGSLYLISGPAPHRLHVIDAETGTARAVFEVGAEADIVASPTVAQGIVYFGDQDGLLFALEGLSGQELWRAKVGSLISTPVVANGAVYIGSQQGELRALGGSLKPALSPT